MARTAVSPLLPSPHLSSSIPPPQMGQHLGTAKGPRRQEEGKRMRGSLKLGEEMDTCYTHQVRQARRTARTTARAGKMQGRKKVVSRGRG